MLAVFHLKKARAKTRISASIARQNGNAGVISDANIKLKKVPE
ncbi:hypothetical protein ABW286_21325 [Erwinia papayae]|uniref:Uncharacterized protein n=1 Tax=Erwinia papayae TaxID=206499 RepID=A0ABV3N7E0_9GAMM